MGDYLKLTVRSSYTLDFHFLDDFTIYQRAKSHDNVVLISKDADFPELISRLGAPPKLINLKIGNCSNQSLWDQIRPRIKQALQLLMNKEIDIVELQ
ncbi:DUF5615 family PIN-like protein [Olivibacter sitiensis]|uniref:DUF5615 family PIN-like protein n=1 Tax=Olivibacter sitiensis TaxID=376470 RepID=UPI0004252312